MSDVILALAPCLSLAVISLALLAAIWKVRDRIKRLRLTKEGLEIRF